MTLTGEQKWKIYIDYMVTLISCNYVFVPYVYEEVKYPNGVIDWSKSIMSDRLYKTNHYIMTFDEFKNTPSKQYSKGNKIDEWYCKFKERIII